MGVPLKARVLLADDHELVRSGLRLIVDGEPDFEVVAEAANGEDAFRRALADDIDLALLDISMPRLTGLQAVRRLSEHRPALRVLLLSMHNDERYVFEARDAGASGYVLKSAAARELLCACRAALRGAPFTFPAGVAPAARASLADGGGSAPGLTRRETEVAKLIAEGLSTRDIAGQLVISVKTVDRHRGKIFAKLGVTDRVALAHYAIRHGLVEP